MYSQQQQQQQPQQYQYNTQPIYENDQNGYNSNSNTNSNNFYQSASQKEFKGNQSGQQSQGLPYIAGQRNNRQPLPPVRTNEEREQMFKHVIQPTKSLVLRSQAIAQSKSEQHLMLLKNSRTLDNHFSQKIHSGPWIAPGLSLKPKYESDSTGIALTFADTDYESVLNQEKKEIQKLLADGFRNWSEYERIRDGEQVITIEYCTNCQDHQGTTRHDEKKYEYIATNLKKELLRHFPVIKVYMKPLITEEQDKSIQNQYARSRLGAMEVQLCSNKNGKLEKNIIFSKLSTKQWPSTLAVLNELRKYMGTCTLRVSLQHEFFDPLDLSEEQKNSKENKLLNVEVILRPLRRINSASYSNVNAANSVQGNVSGYGTVQSQFLADNTTNNEQRTLQDLTSIKSRPVSGVSRPVSGVRRSTNRPMSAQSAFTVQSYTQLPQKEGFAPHGKSIVIKEKTNQAGEAVFKDLPLDVYSLEIKETNDFRAARDQIDIFKKVKDQQQGSQQQPQEPKQVDHQVHLEHVELTFAKFILDPLPNPDAMPKECLIRVLKEGDEDNELEGKISKEFETTLDPGQYTITVEHPVCGTIRQQHEFSFGNQELKLSWAGAQAPQEKSQQKPKRPGSARPQSGNSNSMKELTIQVIDARNQRELIRNCKIEITDDIKGLQSYTTDEEGLCVIKLEGFTKGLLKIKHDDFLEITEEYGPSTMNINKMKDLTFPLIRKPQSDNEINLLTFSDTDKKVMTVFIIAPDGTSSSTSKKDVIIDNNQENSLLIKINRVKETQGVYRIFAKVHDLSLLSPLYVKFYVIESATSMDFVEVPKNHPTLPGGTDIYWDIGALFVPECKFVEINSIQSQQVTQFQDLPALKQISDALTKVKQRPGSAKSNPGLRNLLGFPIDDPKVLQNNNDFQVQKEQIVSSMTKNIFSGKDNASIEHLIHSALLTSGLYSFNKLKAKFEKMVFPETNSVSQLDSSLKEVKQEYEEDEDDDGQDEMI